MKRPEYDPDYFPHWSTVRVRYRDLDTLNHVNNAIFSTYYEEARIDFIRTVPELLKQLEENFSFVLANLSVDFIRPVEYPAKLLIGSGISDLGNSSITSFQAIYEKEEKSLLSTAKASGIWFDLEHQRPTRLPELKDPKQLLIT